MNLTKMTWSNAKSFVLACFGVCMLVLCQGCSRSTPDKSPATKVGDAKATWTYYESIQKADTEDEAEEIFTGFQIDIANTESAIRAASALRELSTLISERSKRMASLPVLKVDPDLTAYAVQLARVRAETATAMTEYASLLRENEDLTSGENLVFSFLLSLGKHCNDGDDALKNALKEQIVEKSSAFADLKPKAAGVFGKISQVSESTASLPVAEMAVRVKLAQKFGREFPPRSDYLAKAKSAAAKKLAATPYPISDKQMMRDLIGRKVSQAAPASSGNLSLNPFQSPRTWTFDGIEEFQSFTVVGSTNNANLTEFSVTTMLKGLTSGQQEDVHLRLAYEKKDSVWKLQKVDWLPTK